MIAEDLLELFHEFLFHFLQIFSVSVSGGCSLQIVRIRRMSQFPSFFSDWINEIRCYFTNHLLGSTFPFPVVARDYYQNLSNCSNEKDDESVSQVFFFVIFIKRSNDGGRLIGAKRKLSSGQATCKFAQCHSINIYLDSKTLATR